MLRLTAWAKAPEERRTVARHASLSQLTERELRLSFNQVNPAFGDVQMKAKSLVAVLLATVASTFATAAAAAFNYNGLYLVTFTYPGGSFQHCIQLTETQEYSGYTDSGTWTDTDFSDTGGNWAVYNGILHIDGQVSGSTDFLTIDGKPRRNAVNTATFDFFDPSGNVVADGSATVALDTTCAERLGNKRSFLY